MNLEELALHLTNELKVKYFDERDFLSLQDFLANDFSLIGTGINEFSSSAEDAIVSIISQLDEYSGKFVVEDSNFYFTKLSDTSCLVYGNLKAIPEDSKFAVEDVRLTLGFEGYPDLKLSHVHFSHPDYTQEDGKYFVPSLLRKDTEALRTDLDAHIRRLESLTTKVPGGAHQCLNDDYLTFASYSDSFLNMFGYTADEINEKFDNRYINMIYPEDREYVLSTVRNHEVGNPNIDFEYRVLNHENKPIWILDKCSVLPYDDDVCFYCILIEIESRKKEQEELRLLLQRYQIVISQTTDIIFEWDLLKDELVFSSNWNEKFGYEPFPISLLQENTIPDSVHPDDIEPLRQIIKNISVESPHVDTEIRLKNKFEKYIWSRIRFSLLYNEKGIAIRAIGVIIDIDEEMSQKLRLVDLAQRDALTGLFNKSAINRLVTQSMEPDGSKSLQALFIIDVDNFKQINDKYGHLCGDRILSEVAGILKNKTRATDFVGRVGGDEFLIYFPHIPSLSAIENRAKVLIDSLQSIKPTNSQQKIGCSIGIALFERNTVDYLTLYQHADEALYIQKSKGRNGYTIYNFAEDNTHVESKSASGTPIVSDTFLIGNQRLSQYALTALTQSTDLESDIGKVLEIIGQYYGVDHVYIFENNEDCSVATITYEWRDKNFPSKSLSQIEYTGSLSNYLSYFNDKGIFYSPCNDYLEDDFKEKLDSQSIKTMIQCSIIDDGKFFGGIGFEDSRTNKNFTDEEIKSFKLTSSVLQLFIIQLRLKQKLKAIS